MYPTITQTFSMHTGCYCIPLMVILAIQPNTLIMHMKVDCMLVHRQLMSRWFGLWKLLFCLSPPGQSTSVLTEMRTALLASQALGLNFTMDLPPDYTPLTLSEGFYMATMGGAEGTLSTEFHKKKVSVVWNWGEPERAPHSHVLKMSVCAILKVCVVLGPLWYRGSCCVVERCGVMWRSWVRVSQRQLLFFLTSILHVCWKRTDNVFYLFICFFVLQKRLWVLHGCFMNILTCCE